MRRVLHIEMKSSAPQGLRTEMDEKKTLVRIKILYYNVFLYDFIHALKSNCTGLSSSQ